MEDLQNALSELKDIHLPDPVSVYQIAPGWWLSAILGLAVIWVCYQQAVKAIRKNRYRRDALKQLEARCIERADLLDDYQLLSEINQLLKSVAIKAYPQQGCAALSGEQWQLFLAQTLAHHKNASTQVFNLFDLLYQTNPTLDKTQRDLLIATARLWLKKHAPLSFEHFAKTVAVKEHRDV